MPTSRPRVLVTETDELQAALDLAARAWPEETSRARLMTQLALLGSASLAARDPEERARRRLAFLDQPREAYSGTFPPGYREGLRDEWPA